jgi:hypothetical protein
MLQEIPMVRIRHGWHLAALGLMLTLAGCNKEEKKGAPGDKTAEKGDKPGVAPSGSSGAVDDLTLLPLDSEIVLGINFSQVTQSSLWKQFVEPKMMTGDVQAKFAEFKAKCDFDPMASFKTVSVGLKIVNDKPDGVIVVHGIDKAKSFACIEKMKDEAAKEGTEMTRDGDVVIMKGKGGEPAAVMFLNDNTAVVALGDKGNAAGVKQVAQGGSTLKSSPPFLDMYGKVKTGDSLWFLINGNAKFFDKAAAMGVKPKAVFGSINVTDGLSLDMRMRMETPDAAAQFANMGKAQIQQAAKMFDQIDIAADGADAKITVVLSNQKLQALIQQVGGMLGGLGGMGK